jgi:hypothetical protein
LLDFMHGEEMPRTEGIDFEPQRAHIELKIPRK